jgi:hypothetical protein
MAEYKNPKKPQKQQGAYTPEVKMPKKNPKAAGTKHPGLYKPM